MTNINVPGINLNKYDEVVWTTSSGMENEFAVKNVCRDLRSNALIVTWWKLVWHSQCIQKHSFILWNAIINRMNTQDRMHKWGNYAVNRCYLCENDSEDLEHLLFKCGYSSSVWNKIKSMAEIHGG